MALTCADTTFLIDLSRESGRESGPVHEFLRNHLADDFAISVTALGEFAAGFADSADETFVAIKSRFRLLTTDEADAGHYRKIFRFLKQRGRVSPRAGLGGSDLLTWKFPERQARLRTLHYG